MCVPRNPVQTVEVGLPLRSLEPVEFREDHGGVCCPFRICHGSMLSNPILSRSDVRGQGVTVRVSELKYTFMGAN